MACGSPRLWERLWAQCLLTAAGLVVVLAGSACSDPCTPMNHCVRDGDMARCESGYVWEDFDDRWNYTCIVDEENAGDGDGDGDGDGPDLTCGDAECSEFSNPNNPRFFACADGGDAPVGTPVCDSDNSCPGNNIGGHVPFTTNAGVCVCLQLCGESLNSLGVCDGACGAKVGNDCTCSSIDRCEWESTVDGQCLEGQCNAAGYSFFSDPDC